MIIFLYGTNEFLAKRKLKELTDRFRRDVPGGASSLEEIEAERVAWGTFESLAAPASLFSQKRLLVIRNALRNADKTFHEKLRSRLDHLASDGNILVFIDLWEESEPDLRAEGMKTLERLKKEKYAQEFKFLNTKDLGAWIKREFEARGGHVSQAVADRIGGLFGQNLRQIDLEIDKLVAYRRARQGQVVTGAEPATVTADDVDLLCRGQLDENIFALTDAIGGRQKGLALRLLAEQYEAGVKDQALLARIASHFRRLLYVRQALDQGWSSKKIISRFKMHPYTAQKAIGQSRHFPAGTLKAIVFGLLDLGAASRSGRAEVKTGLDLLIAKL